MTGAVSDAPPRVTPVPPEALLMLGATLISFAPILVRWIGTEASQGVNELETVDNLGASGIASCRTLVGAGCLFAWCRWSGRPLLLDRRALSWSVLTGALFALDLWAWHLSIHGCGAGMATLLGNTQVFWTALFGRVLFSERLSKRFWLACVAALAGIALLVGRVDSSLELTPRYLTGAILGLATGVAYGGYVVALKGAAREPRTRPDPVTFIAYSSTFSALFLAVPALAIERRILPPDGATAAKLLLLGISAQAVGWLAISTSLRALSASRAGLILLLQPALAMIWALLFFGEWLTVSQTFGALLTLAAVWGGGRRRFR